MTFKLKLFLASLSVAIAVFMLSMKSDARESDDVSSFTVVNDLDGKIKVKVFRSADTQCQTPDSSKTLDPGESRTMTCKFKDNYPGDRRCQVKILNKATNKTVCKPLRNDCDGKAIKLLQGKTLTVSTSTSANSGIACSIG